MKLHQSLFLNIVAFIGLINLFESFMYLYSLFIEKFFNIILNFFLLENFSSAVDLVVPIFLLLFIAEYVIIKAKKLQPIIKNNSKLFKALFYLCFVIAISKSAFWWFVLYSFGFRLF